MEISVSCKNPAFNIPHGKTIADNSEEIIGFLNIGHTSKATVIKRDAPKPAVREIPVTVQPDKGGIKVDRLFDLNTYASYSVCYLHSYGIVHKKRPHVWLQGHGRSVCALPQFPCR